MYTADERPVSNGMSGTSNVYDFTRLQYDYI